MSGFIGLVRNTANSFMQEAPVTHESLKKDMESYLVTESTILERIKKFVTAENINQGIDPDGLQTLLTASLANKRFSVAQYLIEMGADVNMGTQQGGFPVVLAAKQGNFDLIKTMVAKGAGLANCPELISVALSTGVDASMLSFLIKNGAGFSGQDIFAVLHNHDLLKILLQNLPKESLADFSKGMMATKGIDLVSMMLEKKWFHIIRLLCDAGLKLNHKNHIELIESGNIGLVEYLLKSQAFFVNSGVNCATQTPLTAAVQLAAKNPSIGYQMAQLLLNYGADVNGKTRANIINVQMKDKETKAEVIIGKTPLLIAVEQGDKNMVELLCTRKADLEIREIPTEQGLTPLQIAVKNKNVDIIYSLVIWGANVHVLTKTKETLLHGVTHQEMVQYLVGQGLDIFQADGNTPRSYPIAQLLTHEAQKGSKENYDEILDPIFREQISHVQSFIMTLNAKASSRQTLIGNIVAHTGMDMFKKFEAQKENMRKMSLVLATMQKGSYPTHLATKSQEFRELVAEMEQTFESLVTHPEFSAFIQEMTTGQNLGECHAALKFIAGALTPVMGKYDKKSDTTSRAMCAVEAQVNTAILMMGRNKGLHDTSSAPQINSSLQGLSVHHEQRSEGIALMTGEAFIETFNKAVAEKDEVALKTISAQMKPYERFFDGKGDETAQAIHKMYGQLQEAFSAIDYAKNGFFRSFVNTFVSNGNEQEEVQSVVAPVQQPVIQQAMEVAPAPAQVAGNPLVDEKHAKAVTQFKAGLAKEGGSIRLEMNMRSYLNEMKGLYALSVEQKAEIDALLRASKENREQPKTVSAPLVEQQPAAVTPQTEVKKKATNTDIVAKLTEWVDEAITQEDTSALERHLQAVQGAIENKSALKEGQLEQLQALFNKGSAELGRLGKQE